MRGDNAKFGRRMRGAALSSTRSSGGSINCTVRRGRARNSRENVMDRRPVLGVVATS